MINFSVLMTSQSTILLDDLWEAVLPDVIEQLTACGYTVEEDHTPQAAAQQLRPHRKYRIEPGPATLAAVTTAAGDGSLHFMLTGPKFGIRFGTEEADPVLWMRLVTLGVNWRNSHSGSQRR